MTGTVRRRLAVALVASLVLMLAAPLGALAKPAARHHAGLSEDGKVTTQWLFFDDEWESDDTSAQAKVLPEISYHSFTDTVDQDWAKITAEATGTPFVLETEFEYGDWDSEITVYSADTSGNLTQLANNDDSGDFDFSYGSSIFFAAPRPGTYYVCVEPLSAYGYEGEYTTYITKGVARRIAGGNRFATAAKVSKTMYPDAANGNYGSEGGPEGVILCNGYNFPDALAAGALGAMYDSEGGAPPMPVLLTGPTFLADEAWLEIQRLAFNAWISSDEFTVYIVGGEGAVSQDVADEVLAMDYVDEVVRLAGVDRFATASEVATTMADWMGASDKAFLVNGYSFADALAAGAVAGYNWSPVLLTRTSSVPAATLDYLTGAGVSEVVIVGGEAAVSTSVASFLAAPPYSLTVTRVAGVNRYETARLLAEYGINELGMNDEAITLVSGTSFPDGLSAAPMTAFTAGPLLLTPPTALASSVETFYANHRTIDPSYVVGGAGAVSDTVYSRFKNLWSIYPPLP